MKDTTSSEEVMVNPTEISKKTHLLKLCSTSIDGSKPPQNQSDSSSLDLKALSSSVDFKGWRSTTKNFKSWAVKMATLHKPIWIKAGIFEAIVTSTNIIHKDTDLVLSIAEKWCPKTNTFVFSWGETTITLEDVMILLGFSVLGGPVFAGLDSEGEKIKEKLEIEWSKISKVAKSGFHVYKAPWMKRFDGCGDELEHVAFLVVWLCYFVFPSRCPRIYKGAFPIAIHLSRGIRIALATAVLAHLYAELSILKSHITAFTISKDVKRIYLSGLFKLVQVWTWERFRELRPVPNKLIKGNTRLGLWHDLKHRTSKVRQVLDSSKLEGFEWRPYTKAVENWEFPKFYPERAMFVPVDPNLDDEFASFARCFKVSELVGIYCVEHYFPDRIASQFGIIQDVPGPVKRNKLSQKEAWKSYSKPIDDLTLYIPSRSAVPCDYPMFRDWWRKSLPELKCCSEENMVIESDETLKPRNITSFVSSQDKRSMSMKEADVKISGGNTSELLVERSINVADVNDFGSRKKLDSIRADEYETGNKSGKNMVLSALDENNSSDPLLGFTEANHITVSLLATSQNYEDELDVLGSNAEKMIIIDDGSKEPEYLLHEDDDDVDKFITDGTKEPWCLLPENVNSGEKNDNDVDSERLIDDGSKEPKSLLPEDGVVVVENVSAGEKEDNVDDDSLIQQKAQKDEPVPCQKVANEEKASKATEVSNIHIVVGYETQRHDCLLHNNEETSKSNRQLEDLEMRNEDVVEDDVGNDSYERSLLKLRDSFEESSNELKKLESTIDELIIKAQRNLAWLNEQRAKR